MLHYAVKEGRFQMTKTLLEKRADVNAADAEGTTPLFIAVTKSTITNQLVQLLLKYGADVSAVSSGGRNVLYRLNYDSSDESIVDLARVLIKKGASLHNKDSNMYQPIYMAARSGHNELVELFLDHGANIDAQTAFGESPLYLASHAGKRTVVLTLIKRKANGNLKTREGRTALYAVCANAGEMDSSQSMLIIRLLLIYGLEAFTEDFGGKIPLALISSVENGQHPGTQPIIELLARIKAVWPPSRKLKDESIIEQNPTLSNYYQK